MFSQNLCKSWWIQNDTNFCPNNNVPEKFIRDKNLWPVHHLQKLIVVAENDFSNTYHTQYTTILYMIQATSLHKVDGLESISI